MSYLQDHNIINDITLSIRRAILGEITPNLRVITFSISGNKIEIRSYYYGMIDELLKENISDMEAEVIADFAPDYQVNWVAMRYDVLQSMSINNKSWHLAYHYNDKG